MQPSYSSLVRRSAVILSALALAPLAQAQFADDFESYANGSAIEGQNGWQNWDVCALGNQAYNTVVNTQALSGSQSLRMVGAGPGGNFGSDTTHELNGPYTSGEWTMSMWTYIPGSFFGEAYFISLNDYGNCGGPYNWSMQAHFQSSSGNLICDINGGANPVMLAGNVPFIPDTWVELKAEIDLDNDVVTIYYDCVALWEYQWSIGVSSAGGTARLACIDLFPGSDDTTEYFVDDFSLAQGFTSDCPIGTNYCMANPNSTGSPGVISATGSTMVADNNVTITASNLPNNAFGYGILSLTQGFVMNPAGSAGNLCLGGSIGRYDNQIMNTGSAGGFDLVLDLTNTPQPTGFIAIMPMETWNFQVWHRDAPAGGGPATSNFTDAISINFI